MTLADELLRSCDESLRVPARQILVGSLPWRAFNAEARSFGSTSKLILLSEAVITLCTTIGVLVLEMIEEFRRFLLKTLGAQPKQYLPVDQGLMYLETLGAEFAQLFIPSKTASEVLAILRRITNDGQVVQELRGKLSDWDPSGSADGFGWAGAQFVLAHEYGHHLMNHTRGRHAGFISPGPALLTRFLSELELSIPSGDNPSHQDEFEADAMALMLLTSTIRQPTGWYDTIRVAGSVGIALPALQLLADIGEDQLEWADQAADSHPPTAKRLEFATQIVHQAAADHPDGNSQFEESIGREISLNPASFVFQLHGLRSALVQLINDRPGTL